VSNQESSITLQLQLGIFRNVNPSAPITFGVLVGTFVGYLLDRHSYMHACNDYARYALTDLGIHQSLTNTKETLSKSIQHKQR
jgi:hypothetical protein